MTIYQHIEKLLELDSNQQREYLESIDDKNLAQEILSMLNDNHIDFTNLFEQGVVLSAKQIQGEHLIGARLDKYKIIRKLGQGGMGAVYSAKRIDGEFEQDVAIKVFPQESLNQVSTQILNIEAQALASLNHPNIAPVYDAGKTDDGLVYIVMRLIDGKPLSDLTHNASFSTKEKLRLFIKLLDAANHAHTNRVIHQDIKPQNILIDSDNTPFLVDFGIAHIDGKQDRSNYSYLKALSIKYASPEQLENSKLTTHTDIYSLGKVLFSLLTGQEPNVGPLSFEAGKTVDAPLKAIITKATDENVDNRYETVIQLKQDIESYLALEPIKAYENSLFNVKCWCKRNSTKLFITSVAIIAISFGGVEIYNSSLEAQKQSLLADSNLKLAEKMLEQVDIKVSTEFERQLNLINSAKTINLQSLPIKQRVRFIKSLADAYKAIGEYKQYDFYSKRLLGETKNLSSHQFEYLLALKMQAEVKVLYQEFSLAVGLMAELVSNIESSNFEYQKQYIELLDWEAKTMDSFLIPQAMKLFAVVKHNIDPKSLSISESLNYQFFQILESMHNENFEEAIELAHESLEFAERYIDEIAIRYWIRHLMIWNTTSHDNGTPPDIGIFKAKVANTLGRLEALIDKNHPIVTSLALHVINSLAGREDKDLFVLTEHFKNLELDQLIPAFRINQGVNLLNQYIDTGEHKKAYALFQKLTTEIPLASSDSMAIYQVLTYFYQDFGQYELMYENQKALSTLAQKNNNLSWASYFNSELCAQLASKDYKGINKVCSLAVEQATQLYGDDGFWTLEAKLSQFSRYIHKDLAQADLRYQELKKHEGKFEGTWKGTLLRNYIYYWLKKENVEKARENLNKFNDLISKHTKEYSLGTKLTNADILIAEGYKAKAIELLTNGVDKYCSQWPYENAKMARLRELNKELQIEPMDPCPNALKWSSVVTKT